MSVSLFYEPPRLRFYLGCGTSSDAKALTDVFGKPPWSLGQDALPRLEAMAAMCRAQDNPYARLIKAIQRHDAIWLSVEY